ncbi:MAG: HAD family phosphatase [Oscillatoria sp. SIO1A7]|nr:HAD family phosphatase [Oscillatoria sp. SIO1A7]
MTKITTNPSATSPADIKLLVLDIDGTIAGISNQISPKVQQAIEAARVKGVQVAIATGRMYQSALRFHKQIGSSLPLVAYQGAFIKDPLSQTIHQHQPLNQKIALQLLDYFDRPEVRSAISVHCYIDDLLYIRELTPESQAYVERVGVTPQVHPDLRPFVSGTAPTKILALSKDRGAIDHLMEAIASHYSPTELYLTKSSSTFFEAANPGANKGVGVRYLAEELLGLTAANVMVLGDNFNDIEMLEYAGIGIAMGNAPAPVKALAHWVAPDVESDGAATAIEKFLL